MQGASKAICFLTVSAISGIGSPTDRAQGARIVPEARPEFQLESELYDKPIPKLENDYLLVLDPMPENAPGLSVFGPEGSKIFATQLALDGAVHVVIRDIAASAKGAFAITGGALDLAGGAVNFIAYVDSRGAVTRVVRLQDFSGRRLCFTDMDACGWLALPQRIQAIRRRQTTTFSGFMTLLVLCRGRFSDGRC